MGFQDFYSSSFGVVGSIGILLLNCVCVCVCDMATNNIYYGNSSSSKFGAAPCTVMQ